MAGRFILGDPDYEIRISDSFQRQGFMRHIVLPFRAEVSQQHDYFHGGVVGALADNAGAYAAFTLICSAIVSEDDVGDRAPRNRPVERWTRSQLGHRSVYEGSRRLRP